MAAQTDPNSIPTPKIVTRFAPSPTGFLHIGGVRTALFAYLWAKKNNGTFILRIEDTDKEREVAGSIEHIKASLHWLGIEWQYGPDKPGPFGSCIQSERLDTYTVFAHKLIEKGLAYPDPYTKEQIDEFRKKAELEKRPFLFRDHRPETFGVWDGKQPLRFKVPTIKRWHWHDVVRGNLEAGEEALDDFILIKSDGYPTYNFAHIIDDYHMGTTHILRADEFISSTPRFLSLYEALDITPPALVTLPPILRDDRTKKLGKRDGAKDILEYRVEGFLPEAMLNFLALIGWNPGSEEEIMDVDEIMKQFTLEKIQKAGAAFNEEKLAWMNKMHLAKLSDDQFLKRAASFFPAEIKAKMTISSIDGTNAKVLPLIREKIHTFSEIPALFLPEGELSFIVGALPYQKESLMWKQEKDITQTKAHIQYAIDTLGNPSVPEDLTADMVKSALWPYAEKVGRGNLLWPVRFALSGKDKSPDPFVLASILGKKETLKRLSAAYNLL